MPPGSSPGRPAAGHRAGAPGPRLPPAERCAAGCRGGTGSLARSAAVRGAAAAATRSAARARTAVPLRLGAAPLANGGQDGGGSADDGRPPGGPPPEAPPPRKVQPRHLRVSTSPRRRRPPNGNADNALAARSASPPPASGSSLSLVKASRTPPTSSRRFWPRPPGGPPPCPAPPRSDSCGRGLLWAGFHVELLGPVARKETGSAFSEPRSRRCGERALRLPRVPRSPVLWAGQERACPLGDGGREPALLRGGSFRGHRGRARGQPPPAQSAETARARTTEGDARVPDDVRAARRRNRELLGPQGNARRPRAAERG